jgi:hypothetical protein
MYLAAFGVRASPRERDSLVLDLVLDVFDKNYLSLFILWTQPLVQTTPKY